MNEINCNEKGIGKICSRIGLALSTIFIVSTILQALWFGVFEQIPGMGNWLADSTWGMWLGTFVPMYLIGVPVGLLILKKVPGETPQENKLGGKNFVIFLLISFFLMYGGNIIGTVLSFVLSGGEANNALLDYAMDNNPIKILFMVILAPLIEEYIFRKKIIDRTRIYGEKAAVFLSAFTFGLFHMNLFQFFYAFGLGWLFAYIYMRTGRLRYSVMLHGIVNFMGSVVAPAILSMVDLEALTAMDVNATTEEILALYGDMLPGLVLYLLFAFVLVGLAITGLVFLILKCRKLVWREAECQLSGSGAVKTMYINFGMVSFVLLSLSFMIISLL